MTAAAVTADNNRVEDAEAATGWENRGSGPAGAAEAPFAYQGTNLFNRKITDSNGKGVAYVPTNDSGSTVDMTATRRKTWMAKVFVSDYSGLDSTDGVLLVCGSSSGNFYAYVIAGTDSSPAFTQAYPATGGLLIVPMDPNENTAYNDTGKDAGSPTLTAVDYFGVDAAFTTASAKSENMGSDAIDVGSGLYLVNGTGADPVCTMQDFADADGGTVSNRWGYCREGTSGSLIAYGELRVGTTDDSTSTATEYDSTGERIFWGDHLAGAGFSVLILDYGNNSSVFVEGATHVSGGTSTDVDSRTDLVCKKYGGGSGTCTINGTYENFRNVTLLSDTTVDGADIECVLLTQASADVENSIIRTNALTSVACLQDPTFGTTTDLHDVEFIQTGAGHAIEIDTAGTYNLTNITFTGYGADTTDSAALDVTETTGTVTVNVNGGNTPTYKTAGATVNIVNAVTVKVTTKDAADATNIQSARVYLEADTGGDLPAGETVTSITRSGSVATVTHTAHGIPDGSEVNIEGADQGEYNRIHTVTVTGVNTYTYTVSGTPTTPATGTITSTAIVLNELTSASGIAQDTGFNFTGSQPVVGWARRGTTSPRYKTVPISGSIESSVGFTTIAFMVPDE